jgi:amino acid adenylation domain-containing protein
MNDLEKRIAAMSPEQREALHQRLRARRTVREPTIKPVPRDRELPLSFTQERQWILSQLAPDSPAYTIPANVRFRSPLDEALLKRAINEIVRRHEVLRTTYPTVNGRPALHIAERLEIELPVRDLRGLPADRREAEAERLAAEELQRPFDLAGGPLIRTVLLRLDAADHVLLISLHHMVSDAWSLGLFFKELSTLIAAFAAGQPSPLDELPIQYADYAFWQREHLQGERLEAELAYWRDHLAGAPALLPLPTDRPRLAVQNFRHAVQSTIIEPAVVDGIKALAQQADATLFMGMVAAFTMLLAQYSGQRDIVVGTLLSNRSLRETETLIGYLVNMVALRTDLGGDPDFRTLLGRVRDIVLNSFSHQEVPFERVLEAVQPQRAQNYTPIFQVSINLATAADQLAPGDDPNGSSFASRSGAAIGTGQLDLALSLAPTAQGMLAKAVYDASLFDATTIEQMLGQFDGILRAVVRAPERRISRLAQPAAAEQERLLAAWRGPIAEPAPFRPAHLLIEDQATRRPAAPALRQGETTLSYAELNRRANQLAHLLFARPELSSGYVAICLEPSPELIIAMLAVLKSGAAYVPLDPAYPAERLDWMLENSRAGLVITRGPAAAGLSGAAATLLDLEQCDLDGQPAGNPRWPGCAETPAYAIYTSGSTGRPKGVVVAHGALANLVAAARATFELGEGDRVLQFATVSFDTSVEEIFPGLSSGATLVLRDQAMLASARAFFETCQRWGITVLDLPTAYWHELTAQTAAQPVALPESLRLVIIGGERALPERARQWLAAAPGVRLVNTYGPTEATVITTAGELRAADLDRFAEPSLGRPILGSAIYILDRDLRPVPAGAPGELYIGGAGVAQGYRFQAGLTAERFLPDPFAGQPGRRMYRTGDQVRWRGDRSLQFIGRLDRQVKLRGYRVELGEIEAALARLPMVRQAAVVAHEEAPGEPRLVAYVAPPAGAACSAAEIRGELQQRLPAYMAPAQIVVVAELPLTASGKIDYRALPAPLGNDAPAAAVTGPSSPIEEALAEIWSDLLRIPQIDIHESFFSLGGHSLLATQMLFRINQTFEIELPLRTLFEAPSIARLATAIEQQLLSEIEQLSDEEAERLIDGLN